MNTFEELQLPSISTKKSGGLMQACPLCSFKFDSGEAACSGCAMFGGCSMLKCPNCNYEFVAESKIFNWVKKIFTRASLRGKKYWNTNTTILKK